MSRSISKTLVSRKDLRSTDATESCSILGIGFGPANLSLAIALRELSLRSEESLSSLFLEMQPKFKWHGGMLFSAAKMQSTFLEDLVTGRNPLSPFTFINYLKVHDRLVSYSNQRDFFPSRIEFDDYLAWSADFFEGEVEYSCQVNRIEAVEEEGRIDRLAVTFTDVNRDRKVCLTSNIVLATGRLAINLAGIAAEAKEKTFHSSEFHDNFHRMFPDRDALYVFVVVGGGQSSADIVLHLLRSYPNSRIQIVMRQYCYRQVDDSAFINDLFHPDVTSELFNLTPSAKLLFNSTFNGTNYAAVDQALISDIYRVIYEDAVCGRQRTEFNSFTDFVSATFDEGLGLRVRLSEMLTGRIKILLAHAVVLATGYDRKGPHTLLKDIDKYLIKDSDNEYVTSRSYKITSVPEFRPGIYTQGRSAKSHGHSDSVLPGMAARTWEVGKDLAERFAIAAKC